MTAKLVTTAAVFFLTLAASGLTVMPSTAQEEEVNCENPTTQFEMTECAGRGFEAADAELNKIYPEAQKAMRALDEPFSAEMRGAEKALRDGQRGWIAYRDGHCETVGFNMHGGTAEPMVVAGCKEQLTRARTKELQELIKASDL